MTSQKCPSCGGSLIERSGKFGAFLGCENFPRCRQRPINIKSAGKSASVGETSRPDGKAVLERMREGKHEREREHEREPNSEPQPQHTATRRAPSRFSFNPDTAVDDPNANRRKSVTFGREAGILRIAFAAFGTTIANEIDAKLKDPNPRMFTGTDQQVAIWEEFDKVFGNPLGNNPLGNNPPPHVVVQAGPGVGKTGVVLQWLNLAKQAGRQIDVQATTYHSMGLAICRHMLGNVQVNRWKVNEIIDDICRIAEVKERRQVVSAIKNITKACKNALSQGGREDIDTFIDYFNISVPEEPKGENWLERIYSWIPEVLDECRKRETEVDFEDMLWLPVVNAWSMGSDGFDILYTDEGQDTSPIQRYLSRLACPSGRQIVIGDKFQSIFGFRGASVDSMGQFERDLGRDDRGVITLPLTITQRCPESHVELATRLFGRDKLQSTPGAPRGKWEADVSESQAIANMRPGDMVLCRIRRPLIPCAYALLKRGVKALVRGRDFGTDLIEWAKRLEHDGTVSGLLESAEEYFKVEREKLLALGVKGEARLDTLTDRHECFTELCSGMRTPAQVYAKIDALFSDDRPESAVVLSTIHSGKGCESNRVWVLKPELIPHPRANSGWQAEQELNLLWVAVTRAKWDRNDPVGKPGELYFVGPLPVPLELEEGEEGEEGENGNSDPTSELKIDPDDDVSEPLGGESEDLEPDWHEIESSVTETKK